MRLKSLKKVSFRSRLETVDGGVKIHLCTEAFSMRVFWFEKVGFGKWLEQPLKS